jgi:protein-serine/threonine kinase
MAIPESSGETSQPEGEGDGPDKPPHGDLSRQFQVSMQLSHTSNSSSSKTITPTINGHSAATPTIVPGSYPLPPPDSLLTGVKQPGYTRGALEKLASIPLSTVSSGSSDQASAHKRHPSAPQSPVHSPSATSPTDSFWDGPSAPPSRGPSRPPSQPPSRAPSMSAGVSGNKVAAPPAAAGRERRASKASEAPVVTPSKKPASVHSDKGDGVSHKFNLKDLLANGPKLNRKSSQRSTSSKKSDSDAGDGRAKSIGGDSAVSLTQKYGVCQKIAIGKGATSVVRLAHKWDRSEEKLYAIKVRPVCAPFVLAGRKSHFFF